MLLKYKTEHFGKFYTRPPRSFSDLYEVNPRYPQMANSSYSDIIPSYGKFTTHMQNFLPLHEYQYLFRDWSNVMNGMDGSTFYNRVDRENIPKNIPIMKVEEYTITHSVVKEMTKTVYFVVCIFPDDIKVPARFRMLRYYGKAEWFEPFKADNDLKDVIAELKQKFGRKD